MFLSLGEIANDGPVSDDLQRRRSTMAKRTGQPVRRNSYVKGREGRFWRPTNGKDKWQIVKAAKLYERQTRQPGARCGALGSVALEVLELFANLVDHKTGRLDPSLEHLMEKLRRSKDAIVRALKALRSHGFLDWLRRYVPTENAGRGPQVKQTSNAYRLMLPARARQMLPKPAPVPDDFSSAQERLAAGLAAYKASLSPTETVMESDLVPELKAVFLRLGSHVERESGKRSESRSKFLFYRD